jgi:hypothetical protein
MERLVVVMSLPSSYGVGTPPQDLVDSYFGGIPTDIPTYVLELLKLQEGWSKEPYPDTFKKNKNGELILDVNKKPIPDTWAWGYGLQIKHTEGLRKGQPIGTPEELKIFLANWADTHDGRHTITPEEADVRFGEEVTTAFRSAGTLIYNKIGGKERVARPSVWSSIGVAPPDRNLQIAMTPWLYQVTLRKASGFNKTFGAMKEVIQYVYDTGHGNRQWDAKEYETLVARVDWNMKKSKWYGQTPNRVRVVADLVNRVFRGEDITVPDPTKGKDASELHRHYTKGPLDIALFKDINNWVIRHLKLEGERQKKLKVIQKGGEPRSSAPADPNIVQAGVEFDTEDLDRLEGRKTQKFEPGKGWKDIDFSPASELATPDPNDPTHGAKLHQRHTAGAGTVSVPSDLHPTRDLTIFEQRQLEVLDKSMTRMKERYETGEMEEIAYIDWMRKFEQDKQAIRDTVSPPTQGELELRKDADSIYEEKGTEAIEDRKNKLKNEGDEFMAQVPEEDPSIATV